MKPTSRTLIPSGAIILLLLVVAAVILLAAVPPISRDALTHHLYIPRLYLQHGGIFEIPDLEFSYYPMNLDFLYMFALYLGSDIVPKYIHMFFGLATGFLLYRHIKQRLPLHYALLGALFFITIPIIVKLSVTVYVDLGLVFFTTATLFLCFRWMTNDFARRYLLLAGLCCGLAMGTKYNGLIVYFLITLFIPFLYLRTVDASQATTKTAIRSMLLFFLCALLVVSPWFIRNILWTGNPIYPLYNGLFNPQAVADTFASSEETSITGVFATRYALYGENLWQLLALPIRIFFEGMDDDPRYFDGRLNPFLLLLPLFAFAAKTTTGKTENREKITLLMFCLLYFLFAFNTGVLRIRYLTPIIPFLVILAMYGLYNIEQLISNRFSNHYVQLSCWLVPVMLMLTYNGHYMYQQFQIIAPIGYLSGQVSRDQYLTKYRPEYKLMQYANQKLPETAKILCIFLGRRGYYLQRLHVFEDNTNKRFLLSWLLEPGIKPAEIVKRLKEQGFTHIIFRTDLYSQWLQQNITPENQNITPQLVNNYLIPVDSNRNYAMYMVKP